MLALALIPLATVAASFAFAGGMALWAVLFPETLNPGARA